MAKKSKKSKKAVKKSKQRCGSCHKAGHNSRTCSR